MVSLHLIIPACLLHLIAALKPYTGASSSAQPRGDIQIHLAHAPWSYINQSPLHMACIRNQREVLKYILDGGNADTDQLRSLASYDDEIELNSVGHLQSDGDAVVANDVYTSRLHCAALPLDEVRPFPRGVFGLDQKEYDMLATRGKHGTYTAAERDFTPQVSTFFSGLHHQGVLALWMRRSRLTAAGLIPGLQSATGSKAGKCSRQLARTAREW